MMIMKKYFYGMLKEEKVNKIINNISSKKTKIQKKIIKR